MRPTPYVASLRVYEPINSFSSSDQARWNQIKITESTGYQEELRALKRTILPDSILEHSDGAHIIDHDGKRYVAPWSTDRRVWAALEEFKSSLPSSVLQFFVPPSTQETIRAKGEVLENKVPHILTETWMIPPRWFALFDVEERLRGQNNGIPFTIARTDLELAKNRCTHAHIAVRKAFGSGPVEEELAQLLNWLNVFDPRSIVELDYGGLAVYMARALRESGEQGLGADTSIEDVHYSLAGLSAGDGVMAGHGYERITSRWGKVSVFQQAM